VFLLSAPFRKRRRSRVLNGSLWVAYLMADYVATYLLGRLALLVAVSGGDGTRPQLALLWAPFLLLHLGGQETITAFSMEDNTLWKRRALLDFTAQVAMAVYLVAKQ
jgi:fluoride ion exporter CrcB/FEX